MGLSYQGVTYVKYESILRQMQYDNHTEKWNIKKTNLEGDSLSVIAENNRAARQNKIESKQGLRQSYQGVNRDKPSL